MLLSSSEMAVGVSGTLIFIICFLFIQFEVTFLKNYKYVLNLYYLLSRPVVCVLQAAENLHKIKDSVSGDGNHKE